MHAKVVILFNCMISTTPGLQDCSSAGSATIVPVDGNAARLSSLNPVVRGCFLAVHKCLGGAWACPAGSHGTDLAGYGKAGMYVLWGC
jgi:hypothetical protein